MANSNPFSAQRIAHAKFSPADSGTFKSDVYIPAGAVITRAYMKGAIGGGTNNRFQVGTVDIITTAANSDYAAGVRALLTTAGILVAALGEVKLVCSGGTVTSGTPEIFIEYFYVA